MGLVSESTSSTVPVTVSPFGRLPRHIARSLQKRQYNPLTQYFGFGPPAGSERERKGAKQLANATGPLADLIRQFSGFAGGVGPESIEIGKDISAKGSAAYTTLQGQIDQALSALPGYQAQAQQASNYATQYAANAFAPVQNEDLFRTAENRLTQSVNQDAAGRGALDLGSTQQGQTDAVRDLVMQFRGAQDAQQQAAVPMQAQTAQIGAELAQAGVPLAQADMEAIPQLAQLLSARYGIPMEAMGQVIQMLLVGAQGQQQLLQTTSPVVTSKSHSQSIGIL